MNPNPEEELAVGTSAPGAKIYTMGDQILTEVEFDDQEPPIDDGAYDWSDIGDNVIAFVGFFICISFQSL